MDYGSVAWMTGVLAGINISNYFTARAFLVHQQELIGEKTLEAKQKILKQSHHSYDKLLKIIGFPLLAGDCLAEAHFKKGKFDNYSLGDLERLAVS